MHKEFKTKHEAMNFMILMNQARLAANNRKLVVLVDGPEHNFIVMEMVEAIKNEMPVQWAIH